MEGLEFTVETTPGSPPTGMFNGITVGQSGVIYVSGDDANSLCVLNYAEIVSTLDDNIVSIESEKITLEDQVSSLESEKLVLEGEKTTLENQVSSLEDERSVLEGKKSALNEQVSSLESSIVTWRNISMVTIVLGIVLGVAIVFMRKRM